MACKIIESIVESGYYVARAPDGTVIGQGSKLAKRYTEIFNYSFDNDVEGVYTITQPEVKVGLISADDPVTGDPDEPTNTAPEWSATPTITPNWVAGVADTKALSDHTFDADGDTLVYALDSGTLPSAVSLDPDGTLSCTDQITEGSRSGLFFSVSDGVNTPAISSEVTINVDPGAPPGGGGIGKKWNPGHYLKVQGQSTGLDQTAYIAEVIQSIDNFMDDDPLVLGCMTAVAWGAINPTGSTYDWGIIRTLLDRMVLSGKQLILQIQSKSFRSDQSLEGPADLNDQLHATKSSGWGMPLWRDGTGGFPDVMGRYITMAQALLTEFDSYPNLEILVPTESALSLGGGFAPADYTTEAFSTQLQRMYTALAPYAVKTNIAANVNTLGNEEATLVEAAYQAGLIHSTPDLKATDGYEAFEGILATRDYRGIMGSLEIYSNDVAVQGGGITPTEAIVRLQGHQVTHMAWIPSTTAQGKSSWDGVNSVLAAINVDPTVTTTCPDKYNSCDI